MRTAIAALVIVLIPALCAAQTSPPNDAATQMVRAAGMPLNDGALAPGMLTVRVVEGAFTRDFANQLVDVEVAGGKIESARTGPDGRAQFAHLPIGARVRARASVEGERLESDSFEMPAQSGVRVLLVAGSGAGAPTESSTSLPPNHPPLPEAGAPVPIAPAPPRDGGADGVLAVRAVLVTATVFAFGMVLFRRPRR
jgi:hypothetical protein